MAQPLDLEALGVPGKRNAARVEETRLAVRPFVEGKGDLEIGPQGSVFPIAQASTQENDPGLRSRIGRRFRSF